jgi:DNA ligase 1
MLSQASGVESFILDSEIVAIDPKAESLQSFQDLSGRARKDVKIEDVSIPVCVFAFDLMSLNGEVRTKPEIRGSVPFLHRAKATTTPIIPSSS